MFGLEDESGQTNNTGQAGAREGSGLASTSSGDNGRLALGGSDTRGTRGDTPGASGNGSGGVGEVAAVAVRPVSGILCTGCCQSTLTRCGR